MKIMKQRRGNVKRHVENNVDVANIRKRDWVKKNHQNLGQIM